MALLGECILRLSHLNTRQYHTFNSAVCLGTLVLRDPRNILADFALTQITLATNLYGTLVQSSGPTPRVIRNLQWLVRLQTRATSKIASAKGQPGQNDLLSRSRSEGADSNEGDDVELLGWRTRLVERAIQNKPHARTVESPRTPLTENPPSAPDTAQFISSLLQTSGAIVPVTDLQLDTSTDVPVSATFFHGRSGGDKRLAHHPAPRLLGSTRAADFIWSPQFVRRAVQRTSRGIGRCRPGS